MADTSCVLFPTQQRIESRNSALHASTFRGLGSEINLWLAHAHAPIARAALGRARHQIERLEATLSRFRPDSELSRLNASPERDVPVSAALWECLTNALASAARTDGVYDPTILNALEAAGYDRPFVELDPTNGPIPAPPTRGRGWRSVELDARTRTVRLPAGVRVDLGGVGKSWIAERAAEWLGPFGPCLVDAGGDIAVRGVPPGEKGWLVGLADPRSPDDDLAWLTIADCGVATSGVEYRRWSRRGVTRHHVIDPRTGAPASTDLLSVTVIAPRADDANVHALVALIEGAVAGHEYLDQQPHAEGLLVRADGSMLRTGGFERYEVTAALS